jgi:benzylsuccinate CoA-transferase BbsF subunit
MTKKLLDGIKIVDFTAVIAGPFLTKTLAAHGADILKIESRTHPDLFRGRVMQGMRQRMANRQTGGQFNLPAFEMKTMNPWLNRQGGFGIWNSGKRSIAINLTKPRGVELAKQLVAHADIVTENFAGGVINRMGLGYEVLKKVKPDIIMLSSCMQGQTGPHAIHPGFGTQLINLAGLSNISGWPDLDPSSIGPYTDYVAPQFSILAIMAALDYRAQTGKGQYIDLSQYESTLHYMAPLILDNQVNQRISIRMGNKSPYAAPHNAYRCRNTNEDRWIALAVWTQDEWEGLCEVLGNPPWTKEPKFSTLSSRRKHASELDKLIEEWTRDQLPRMVELRLHAERIPAIAINSREEYLKIKPQLDSRSPYTSPQGIYRCRWEDRWCVISVYTDEEWKSFCNVIRNPDWVKDPKFATLSDRKANEEELDERVSEWTINYSPEEVMHMMQHAGVAAGIVQTGEDCMEKDPQLRLRKFYQFLEHPEIGEGGYHGITPSFIMSKCPVEMKRSPLMGEHSEIILKEMLGMSDDDIETLIADEVLE